MKIRTGAQGRTDRRGRCCRHSPAIGRCASGRACCGPDRAALRLYPRCLGLPILVLLALRWLDPPASAFMLVRQWSSCTTAVRLRSYRWSRFRADRPAPGRGGDRGRGSAFPGPLRFRFPRHRPGARAQRPGPDGARRQHHQPADRQNLFLWSGRSLRKGLEGGRPDLGMEMLWPKRRILEVYLNIAEFGDGEYGAQAAAEQIFHSPDRLSRQQAGHRSPACCPTRAGWTPVIRPRTCSRRPAGCARRWSSWAARLLEHL